MLAEYPVQYDLQYFDIDDNETGIDEEVHHGHEWIAEHFFLTESEEQDISPAYRPVIAEFLISSEFDIAADLSYFF